jgi:bacterioferritin
MAKSEPDRTATHKLLNRIIGTTWTAYAQHSAHVALLESWGIQGLADTMRAHILDEPVTIALTTNRLLELDGKPAFELAAVNIGADLRSVLTNDLERQRLAPALLNQAAEAAAAAHDATTRRLVENILADEEAHLDWLRTELELLERLGDALYTAHRLAPATTSRQLP